MIWLIVVPEGVHSFKYLHIPKTLLGSNYDYADFNDDDEMIFSKFTA